MLLSHGVTPVRPYNRSPQCGLLLPHCPLCLAFSSVTTITRQWDFGWAPPLCSLPRMLVAFLLSACFIYIHNMSLCFDVPRSVLTHGSAAARMQGSSLSRLQKIVPCLCRSARSRCKEQMNFNCAVDLLNTITTITLVHATRVDSQASYFICTALHTGSRTNVMTHIDHMVCACGLCTIPWFLTFCPSLNSFVTAYCTDLLSKSKKRCVLGILLDGTLWRKLGVHQRALIQQYALSTAFCINISCNGSA